jgi:glycosyltransferase involved in cell wall biosynthesis
MKQHHPEYILFANTRWFLINFKMPLILAASNQGFNVKCIYLRQGNAVIPFPCKNLESTRIQFSRFNLRLLLSFYVNYLRGLLSKSYAHRSSYISVFTIGPIILSIFIPLGSRFSTSIVIEGLGRIFCADSLVYRAIKKIVKILYTHRFKYCDAVITLNSSDAAYLATSNIAEFYKIKLIPGTGLDCEALLNSYKNKTNNPQYIDFIGRLVPEKGFYDFIYSQKYFCANNPNLSHLQYRIVAPASDFQKLGLLTTQQLERQGFVLQPYLPDITDIYSKTAVLVHPSRYSEGLSRVVMESALLGIPIVTTANRGIQELMVPDYKYFLDTTNPFRIAQLISECLHDYEYFAAIRRSQRSIIEINYSEAKSIADFFQAQGIIVNF